MAKYKGADPLRSEKAMGDMNTTPLIDVMLVLLIMFIITVPVQTHSVDLDLPGPAPGMVVDSTRNTVTISPDDSLRWNDELVNAQELRTLMALAAAHPDLPELHLKPHELARYERVDEVLADARRVGAKKLGFVGNEQYRAAF